MKMSIRSKITSACMVGTLLCSLVVSDAAVAKPSLQASGAARGYLTTPQELAIIRQKSDTNQQPYAGNVQELLSAVGSPSKWDTNYVFTSNSVSCTETYPSYLSQGSRLTYGKTLAYHLTGNTAYADDAINRIMGLTSTTSWGGSSYSGSNQCILDLSWYVPHFIMAADLLEGYSGWTATKKTTFQTWLASEVYKKVSWASRVRINNWGSGGSVAAAMIADYLNGTSLTLSEVSPSSVTLTPAQAYVQHTQRQRDRMNTVWAGDSQCSIHGIQSHGGIPDELRRGTTGCTGTYILTADKSLSYQMTHPESLVLHAEVALRRGDHSLYDNLNSDGTGSLKQSLLFVIDNPTKSYDWEPAKKAMLHVANRYYDNSAIANQFVANDQYIRSGDALVFGRVTHQVGTNDIKSLPPVTLSPGASLIANESFGSSTGMNVVSGGVWSVTNSSYSLTNPVTTQPIIGNLSLYPSMIIGDVTAQVKVRAVGTTSIWNDVAIIFAYRDAQNYSYVSLNESNDNATSGVFVVTNGVTTEISDITNTILSDTWYSVRLARTGTNVTVAIDNKIVARTSNPAFSDGKFGLGTRNDSAQFDDFMITDFN